MSTQITQRPAFVEATTSSYALADFLDVPHENVVRACRTLLAHLGIHESRFDFSHTDSNGHPHYGFRFPTPAVVELATSSFFLSQVRA